MLKAAQLKLWADLLQATDCRDIYFSGKKTAAWWNEGCGIENEKQFGNFSSSLKRAEIFNPSPKSWDRSSTLFPVLVGVSLLVFLSYPTADRSRISGHRRQVTFVPVAGSGRSHRLLKSCHCLCSTLASCTTPAWEMQDSVLSFHLPIPCHKGSDWNHEIN